MDFLFAFVLVKHRVDVLTTNQSNLLPRSVGMSSGVLRVV